MNIAVIGSGGREHAICYKLIKSKKVGKLICIPGNAGTKNIAQNIDANIHDFKNLHKIFLKEIGKIPSLFAYPYGEADEKIINILKEYKYKVAFGQHSGVINDTSNLYYLPRFSLNERYGEID